MKGKILIVDDEPELRMLLKSILETDFSVTDADSGATLIKKFSDDAPDVILLDLKLPDANGSELYVAVEMGRKAIGAELKTSYYEQAIANLRSIKKKQTDLFGAA